MSKFSKIICLALLLSLCSLAYANIKITVIGQAAGSGKIARQQALADALRKAVRKGAGVNIISSTQVSDYVLDFDRVFSRAFGYIKSFKILSSGYDDAGLYYVKISASVGKGVPGMNDYLAMRQIIAMKGSPRLLIRVSGKISDIGNAEKLIDGQLREIALKCGFQTIKISQFKEAESKRAKRDRLLGNSDSATYRRVAIRSNYDFVIDAEVSGAYNGESKLYGVKTQRFSLGADLGAAYPNGKAIAQVTIPSMEMDIALVSNKTQAARSALQKTLGGDKGKNFRALLMRVLASWVAEFDGGAMATVEFATIDRELLDEVVKRLKQVKGVNAVSVREFDEQFKSTIEVESNLKTHELASLISSLSSRLKIERTTSDYIQMKVVDDAYSFTNILIILVAAAVGIVLLVSIMGSLKGKK